MVEVDPVLFEQVLFNLLDNAAKYAPAGTTVRIQSWRGRDTVGLQILDEGEGIPPGDLEQIFDKFYRARKADHVRAGTGLGLAISRGFVEAMQGTLRRRTARIGPERCLRSRFRSRQEQNWTPPHECCPAKVLVIDDEPPIRKLLRMGLSTQGYEILEAPNAKTALQLLEQKSEFGHPGSRVTRHTGTRIAENDSRAE